MSNDKTSSDQDAWTWMRSQATEATTANGAAPPDSRVPITPPGAADHGAPPTGFGQARRGRRRLSVDELAGSRRPCGVAHTGTRPLAGDRDHSYLMRLAAIADRLDATIDLSLAQDLLREAGAALGADQAAFISFVSDDQDSASFRFMLACDLRWRQQFVTARSLVQDPWLTYAMTHSQAAVASTLLPGSDEQQLVDPPAMWHGCASALLVPAHSGAGHSRVGLLCLGSTTSGHFEEGAHRIEFGARALAMHLHEWWLVRMRRELIMRARISANDLDLLTRQHLGHTSKHIARALQVSEKSVNSRFQRMFQKLGVPNRRKAAKLAAECGLIQV